jgi:hypothetical protein
VAGRAGAATARATVVGDRCAPGGRLMLVPIILGTAVTVGRSSTSPTLCSAGRSRHLPRARMGS